MPKLSEVEGCLATGRGNMPDKLEKLGAKKPGTSIDMVGKVLQAKKFIETMKGAISSNEVIALEVGLSESSLSKAFKKVESLSLNKYIQQRRIAWAKEILTKEKDSDLLETSMRVGYESLSAFYRHFKEIAGIAPAQYRKNAEIEKN